MIREAIAKVVEGQDLTADEAAQVMGEVMGDEATPAQLGAFLTALRVKGETLDEITGMATVMRSNALAVDVEGPLVDTCGTGGDASHTFNISTTVGLVAAGAPGSGSPSTATARRPAPRAARTCWRSWA